MTATSRSAELLAPLIRNYLLRELGKLTNYIDNDCQGDGPAIECARHIAEGRKIQVEKMLDDPAFRLAAKPAEEVREAAQLVVDTFNTSDNVEHLTSVMNKLAAALSTTGAPKP